MAAGPVARSRAQIPSRLCFFRHERSTFCSFVQQPPQLQTSTTPTSEASKTKRKKQNRRPQPRNHNKDPHFFSELCDFLKLFGLKFFPQRVPPSIFSDVLQHNGCQKTAKGPPFYIFRHCDTVQKSR